WGSNCPRALRAVAGRAVPADFSSKDRQYRGDDSSTDRASLLEFIRALCAKKPGAVALDVQTLALPSCKTRSALSILCKFSEAIRRDASASRGGKHRDCMMVDKVQRSFSSMERMRHVSLFILPG